MRFTAVVEPPEPMHGLEVPADAVETLGAGKRPRVTVTLNGHSWRTTIAIMRGRHLIGLSHANRRAAGVAIGDTVDVEVAVDTEPAIVAEPPDLARALDADPSARANYDQLSHSRKRALVHGIDTAKKAETRQRRIDAALAALRSSE